jgi:hypothetical protein
VLSVRISDFVAIYKIFVLISIALAAGRPALPFQSYTSTTTTADAAASQNTIVNILAFGADPTGVGDSAAAVRMAVASQGQNRATLYFPKGTYRFASHGATAEECVRIASSLSLLGDGPGQTIFIDDASPACTAQFGLFWSMGTAIRDDYSFESDPGYPVNAATAVIGSTTISLTQVTDALRYSGGQYVYVRGASLPQPGEYHGELNIATAVNSNTGAVTLAWPLSSSFTQDAGVQLNLVANSEVVTNIQVSGITFNFHNNALLAAQILDLKISNNEFNYLGSSAGWEVSQLDQLHTVEFSNNIVRNPLGPALDVERTSNAWNVHNNLMFGYFDAGEDSANIHFHDNTINCTSLPICVRVGGTTGNTIDHNQINSTCPTDSCNAVTDVSGPVTSPNTVITNNNIMADGPRAISVQTPGTIVSENTISTRYTGIDIAAADISVLNNTVTLTGSGPYGCVLIEGVSHQSLIQGLTCNGNSATYDRAIWIADNGNQANTPALIDGIVGNNLLIGIYVVNGQNDSPLIGKAFFTNTANPFFGKDTWTFFGNP